MPKEESGRVEANAVFEGGGVKGIGLVGALSVAEKRGYDFGHVAGTSIGAIVGCLVAAGYGADEIWKMLYDYDFKRVVRLPWLARLPIIGIPLQLRLHLGLYDPSDLMERLDSMLAAKGIKTFGDLRTGEDGPFRYRLQVVASDISKGVMVLLPGDLTAYGIRPDEYPVMKAVRMSMAVPVMFVPGKLRGSVMVDGALCSNYPVWVFDRGKRPERPTFGFKIISAREYRPKRVDNVRKLMEASVFTMMEAHDMRYIRTHDFERTIPIDTEGYGIAEFWLTKEQKRDLYERGREAAENFFNSYDHDAYLEIFGEKLGD